MDLIITLVVGLIVIGILFAIVRQIPLGIEQWIVNVILLLIVLVFVIAVFGGYVPRFGRM